MSETADAAKDLIRRKLPIALCRGKKPIGGKGWGKRQWTVREVDKAFAKDPALNVGIIWGPRSKLVDLEADSPKAESDFAELFAGEEIPVTPVYINTRRRLGKPGAPRRELASGHRRSAADCNGVGYRGGNTNGVSL